MCNECKYDLSPKEWQTTIEGLYMKELYKTSGLFKEIEALKKEVRRLKRLKKPCK